MTEKEARRQVDEEVRGAIKRGVAWAGELERELRASSAAKVLRTPIRPLHRVVDQALQRLRRYGYIEFDKLAREWRARS